MYDTINIIPRPFTNSSEAPSSKPSIFPYIISSVNHSDGPTSLLYNVPSDIMYIDPSIVWLAEIECTLLSTFWVIVIFDVCSVKNWVRI